MNENFEIESLLKLKLHNDCLNLDPSIIELITNLYCNNDYKNKKNKNYQKKIVNILKNPKIQIIKDKILNKVNLILNKLSENNIENLTIEFLENIKINNINDYNEFIKIFYYKILSEINFSKYYLKFFYLITEIYKNVYGYNIEYFYNLIESKFIYDYEDIIDDEYNFLVDIDDKRINNLTLIMEMIKLRFFNDIFKLYFEEYILNQHKYLSDIYHIFKNIEIKEQYIISIKNLLNNNDIQLRDKVLLENLINGNNEDIESNTKIIFKKKNTVINTSDFIQQNIHIKSLSHINNILLPENNILLPENNIVLSKNNIVLSENNIVLSENNIVLPENNTVLLKRNVLLQINNSSSLSHINNTTTQLKNKIVNIKKTQFTVNQTINNIELENILEEYFFIDNSESLEEYITLNCIGTIPKNKICEFIIDKYFNLENKKNKKLLLLFKLLIKKKILFKSNLSRALNSILVNKNNYSNEKIKIFLLFLKNNGITNGLEALMKKYEINIEL
jgi:hypothetical protein